MAFIAPNWSQQLPKDMGKVMGSAEQRTCRRRQIGKMDADK